MEAPGCIRNPVLSIYQQLPRGRASGKGTLQNGCSGILIYMFNAETPTAEPVVQLPKLKIADVLTEVGLDVEKVAPRIVARLELLNEITKTVEDGEKAISVAKAIFEYYEQSKPDEAFSDLEKKTVVIGSLFSDVGKTGPKLASTEQQTLICEMFAVENVMDPSMTVSKFFETYFPADFESRKNMFEEMELDLNMTMRNFWNMHSLWTLEIISGDGIPPEAVAAAASHHIIEGVNPMNIIGEDNRFSQYFGENASFDRAEKLIILLDKYDAFVRRSMRPKAEAIELLKSVIGKNSYFKDDAEFMELIRDLSEVVNTDEEVLDVVV